MSETKFFEDAPMTDEQGDDWDAWCLSFYLRNRHLTARQVVAAGVREMKARGIWPNAEARKIFSRVIKHVERADPGGNTLAANARKARRVFDFK